MSIRIRPAGAGDAVRIADLCHRLLCEISPEDETVPDLDDLIATSRLLLTQHAAYLPVLAESGAGEPVGLVSLNECAAIYAGGHFGEITELYVVPEHRSRGVAVQLVNHVVALARERGWTRLEVGAPDQPRWRRTLRFYRNRGFTPVGPRLKLVL